LKITGTDLHTSDALCANAVGRHIDATTKKRALLPVVELERNTLQAFASCCMVPSVGANAVAATTLHRKIPAIVGSNTFMMNLVK